MGMLKLNLSDGIKEKQMITAEEGEQKNRRRLVEGGDGGC